MAAHYTLKIVTDFASAHTLRDYPGDCSRLHGHNWKAEIEVRATNLNESGMVIDFKDIKEATRNVTKDLDHHYLNDLEPFKIINPTAENIAAYLYKQLSEKLNNEHVQINAVTLWETERACVRYTEE